MLTESHRKDLKKTEMVRKFSFQLREGMLGKNQLKISAVTSKKLKKKIIEKKAIF